MPSREPLGRTPRTKTLETYAACGLSPCSAVRKVGLEQGTRLVAAWRVWHGRFFRSWWEGHDVPDPPGSELLS